MLVLSRKPNQAIHIGSNIKVTVLGTRGGVVKLGIEAPPDVHILRGELADWYDFGEEPEPAASEAALTA